MIWIFQKYWLNKQIKNKMDFWYALPKGIFTLLTTYSGAIHASFLVLINFYWSYSVCGPQGSSPPLSARLLIPAWIRTLTIFAGKFYLCWHACSKFTSEYRIITLWGWAVFSECSTTKLICLLIDCLLVFVYVFLFVLLVLVTTSQYPSECQEISQWTEMIFWKEQGWRKEKKRRGRKGKLKVHPHYG